MTSNQQLSNFIPASLNQKSFGANLVKVLTIPEKLSGDYITSENSTIQPEQNNEDLLQVNESFDTTPATPLFGKTDDPFADNAEELLDGPL